MASRVLHILKGHVLSEQVSDHQDAEVVEKEFTERVLSEIERHHLKPEAEATAQSLEGVKAVGGAAWQYSRLRLLSNVDEYCPWGFVS